jgi:hypothetical protein
MAAARIAIPLLCAALGLAQQRTISFRAGTLHLIQGNVSIDGKRVFLKRGLAPQTQMHNGQRMHVDRGRVELWLGPGAELTMNEGSTLRMEQNDLSDVRLVLETGSALIKVEQVFKGGRLRMMVPDGAVEMSAAGWYRFDAKPRQLRVYRGGADVLRGDSVVKAKKGQAVDLAAAAAPVPSSSEAAAPVSRFDLKAADPLIAWELQRERDAKAALDRFYQGSAMLRARRTIQDEEHQQMSQDQQRVQQVSPAPPSSPAQ